MAQQRCLSIDVYLYIVCVLHQMSVFVLNFHFFFKHPCFLATGWRKAVQIEVVFFCLKWTLCYTHVHIQVQALLSLLPNSDPDKRNHPLLIRRHKHTNKTHARTAHLSSLHWDTLTKKDYIRGQVRPPLPRQPPPLRWPNRRVTSFITGSH